MELARQRMNDTKAKLDANTHFERQLAGKVEEVNSEAEKARKYQEEFLENRRQMEADVDAEVLFVKVRIYGMKK